MVEPRAAVLDVVDHAPFAAARYLAKPNRCAVVYPEIPRSPHIQRRIMGHRTDAAITLCELQDLAIIAAGIRGVERTHEFLIELFSAHFLTQPRDRLVREGFRLRIIEQVRRMPRCYTRAIVRCLK